MVVAHMNSEKLWLSEEDSYGYLSTELHKINAVKKCQQEVGGVPETLTPTQEPLAADGCLLGMENQFSLKEATGRLPMLHWITPHLCRYGKF